MEHGSASACVNVGGPGRDAGGQRRGVAESDGDERVDSRPAETARRPVVADRHTGAGATGRLGPAGVQPAGRVRRRDRAAMLRGLVGLAVDLPGGWGGRHRRCQRLGPHRYRWRWFLRRGCSVDRGPHRRAVHGPREAGGPIRVAGRVVLGVLRRLPDRVRRGRSAALHHRRERLDRPRRGGAPGNRPDDADPGVRGRRGERRRAHVRREGRSWRRHCCGRSDCGARAGAPPTARRSRSMAIGAAGPRGVRRRGCRVCAHLGRVGPTAGVELVARAAVGGTSQVGWPAVVGVSISACLAASLVLWRLRRRATSHVEGMWRGACVGVTAVSLLGPLHLAVGASSAAGLLSLHLVCAVTTLALLAPGTRRVAAPAPARPSDATDGSPAFEVQPGRRA